MTTRTDDPRAALRRNVYWLLIILATGSMAGRVLSVDSVNRLELEKNRIGQIEKEVEKRRQLLLDREVRPERIEEDLAGLRDRLWDRAVLRRPFLSANDRSRWCTIRALVEAPMRVEGHAYSIDKVLAQRNWDTIDMVRHDGHSYSSKPPLLPTIMAAEYWLIAKITERTSGVPGGMTLATNPYAVGRFMLITFNVIPMFIFFWLLSRLVERLGKTDFGRIFVMGAATFGTFLTTFAVVLNNHLPAAVCAMAAIYAFVRIYLDDKRGLHYFAIAGFFAAFAAANELPALALLGMLGLVLVWVDPIRTLGVFVPAAMVVVAAFFATNMAAHDDFLPPYLHRSATDSADNWYDFVYYTEDGKRVESYWNHPAGVDQGEPSRCKYAFHVLIGHHGIFSLTPIWLMAIAGALHWLVRGPGWRLRGLAGIVLLVTAVCLAFYLSRGLDHRNYGGVTSGFRWMFWFAPMWLLTLLPAADAMARWGWTRGIALILLAFSVLSVSYPTWNPWVQPWLWDYLESLPWLQEYLGCCPL